MLVASFVMMTPYNNKGFLSCLNIIVLDHRTQIVLNPKAFDQNPTLCYLLRSNLCKSNRRVHTLACKVSQGHEIGRRHWSGT